MGESTKVLGLGAAGLVRCARLAEWVALRALLSGLSGLAGLLTELRVPGGRLLREGRAADALRALGLSL